jgi:hypothetical protein
MVVAMEVVASVAASEDSEVVAVVVGAEAGSAVVARGRSLHAELLCNNHRTHSARFGCRFARMHSHKQPGRRKAQCTTWADQEHSRALHWRSTHMVIAEVVRAVSEVEAALMEGDAAKVAVA